MAFRVFVAVAVALAEGASVGVVSPIASEALVDAVAAVSAAVPVVSGPVGMRSMATTTPASTASTRAAPLTTVTRDGLRSLRARRPFSASRRARRVAGRLTLPREWVWGALSIGSRRSED